MKATAKGRARNLSTYIRDLDLVTFLQMLSECVDEFTCGYVLDCVSVLVNEGEVCLKDSR